MSNAARPLGDFLADPAHAEDRRSSCRTAPCPVVPLPLAGLHGPQVRPEVLGQRDHQPERVLGDGRVVDAGREEHGDLLAVACFTSIESSPMPYLAMTREPRQRGVDHAGGDQVVAVEQAVEAAAL